MESYEELVSRHEKEASELADSIKAMLKAAKKSQRAELEAKAIQMNFDLKARHREEEEEWESNNGRTCAADPLARSALIRECDRHSLCRQSLLMFLRVLFFPTMALVC